jgi:RimJ/RimL family protein N-acetyltransferase
MTTGSTRARGFLLLFSTGTRSWIFFAEGSGGTHMTQQLFEGDQIRFVAFDADRDAEAFSRWTHDLEYLRLTGTEPLRPHSPFQVKKAFEEREKETGRSRFYFVIRSKQDERTIGWAEIRRVEWNHGNAEGNLGIGDPSDRGKGYGSEALEMLLRYAFQELNLYRLTVQTMEYNEAAQRLLEGHGFQLEVRRRKAIYSAGRYWDGLTFGILAEEWLCRHPVRAETTDNKRESERSLFSTDGNGAR